MTYVSSAVSLHPVEGQKHPQFIRNMWNGHALVVRSYANKGLLAQLRSEKWQKHTSPFLISFFSSEVSSKDRLDEFRKFVVTLMGNYSRFQAPIALEIDTTANHCLQINDHGVLVNELRQMLDFASKFGIPLIPKISIAVPKDIVQVVAQHPSCDAISLHSGIPWGAYSKRLNWKHLFGSEVSPLAADGNGELFGAPCMPILKDWLRLSPINFDKPLIAASCIYSVDDARDIVEVGALADAISLGAVALLRPWRVASLVRYMER